MLHHIQFTSVSVASATIIMALYKNTGKIQLTQILTPLDATKNTSSSPYGHKILEPIVVKTGNIYVVKSK